MNSVAIGFSSSFNLTEAWIFLGTKAHSPLKLSYLVFIKELIRISFSTLLMLQTFLLGIKRIFCISFIRNTIMNDSWKWCDYYHTQPICPFLLVKFNYSGCRTILFWSNCFGFKTEISRFIRPNMNSRFLFYFS